MSPSTAPPTCDEPVLVDRVSGLRTRRLSGVGGILVGSDRVRGVGALGARELADHGYVVLSSPAGFPFCFVSHRGSGVVPPPPTWAAGQNGGVYQLCLDIPDSASTARPGSGLPFSALTSTRFAQRSEFTFLRTTRTTTLDVLLQCLGESGGTVRAHLDCGSDDRVAEVARHRALGAGVVATEDFWTVLTDPAGLRYCITDRDPVSRRLPPTE